MHSARRIRAECFDVPLNTPGDARRSDEKELWLCENLILLFQRLLLLSNGENSGLFGENSTPIPATRSTRISQFVYRSRFRVNTIFLEMNILLKLKTYMYVISDTIAMRYTTGTTSAYSRIWEQFFTVEERVSTVKKQKRTIVRP